MYGKVDLDMNCLLSQLNWLEDTGSLLKTKPFYYKKKFRFYEIKS